MSKRNRENREKKQKQKRRKHSQETGGVNQEKNQKHTIFVTKWKGKKVEVNVPCSFARPDAFNEDADAINFLHELGEAGNIAFERNTPGNLLYHYTGLEAMRGIVEKRVIWASDALCSNDASELQEGTQIFEEVVRQVLTAKARETGDTHYIWLLHFCRDFMRELSNYSRTNFNNDMRGEQNFLLCFAGNADSLPQWNLYGKEGYGYCLGFDNRPKTKNETEASLPFLLRILNLINKNLQEKNPSGSEGTRQTEASDRRDLFSFPGPVMYRNRGHEAYLEETLKKVLEVSLETYRTRRGNGEYKKEPIENFLVSGEGSLGIDWLQSASFHAKLANLFLKNASFRYEREQRLLLPSYLIDSSDSKKTASNSMADSGVRFYSRRSELVPYMEVPLPQTSGGQIKDLKEIMIGPKHNAHAIVGCADWLRSLGYTPHRLEPHESRERALEHLKDNEGAVLLTESGSSHR